MSYTPQTSSPTSPKGPVKTNFTEITVTTCCFDRGCEVARGIVFHHCCHLCSAISFISFLISLAVRERAGCSSWMATVFSFAIPSTTSVPVTHECPRTHAKSIWHMSFADSNSWWASRRRWIVGQIVSLSTVSPLFLSICGDLRSAKTVRHVWLPPPPERRKCLQGHHHYSQQSRRPPFLRHLCEFVHRGAGCTHSAPSYLFYCLGQLETAPDSFV